MVRTEHYKIMPCYEHFTVYYQGIFLSNCDTTTEAEQEIIEHIEQNTERRTEQHERIQRDFN